MVCGISICNSAFGRLAAKREIMAHMSITFDGFDSLAERIDKIGANLHDAVDEALNETQSIVQENLTVAAAPYTNGGVKGYAKGQMFGSIIKDEGVKWKGNIAEVRVGFDLSTKGGFHSIFIMYGVPRHRKSNRGISKDTKVYNAIRGVKTKQQIEDAQQRIMEKYLSISGD